MVHTAPLPAGEGLGVGSLSVNLPKLLERCQCSSALYRLSCYVYTFLNGFLSAFECLDAKCRIGYNDVLLGWQCTVLKHCIEYLGGFLFGGTGYEFFGLCLLHTEIGGREDTLIGIGGNLEVARKRNLVVSVDAVDYSVIDTQATIHLAVELHLTESGYAQ